MRLLLHRLVAIPAIYDLAQWMAGARRTRWLLREEFTRFTAEKNLLDVGGGTGLLRPLLPASWKYTCVDLDAQKLEGFRRKFPQDIAIKASATDLPFLQESFDLVVLCAVSHHLTDDELATSLREISRVLKPDGSLLFLDALKMPGRVRSRTLWALDRGSHSRTLEQLREAISGHFRVERELCYQIHHVYVRWTLRKHLAFRTLA